MPNRRCELTGAKPCLLIWPDEMTASSRPIAAVRHARKDTTIICHVASNAGVARQWQLCLIGMAMALPFFLFSRKGASRMAANTQANAGGC